VIVSTNNINTSTVLEEPDTLQNLRNVDGDPGPEPTLPRHSWASNSKPSIPA
jgi:hypothetical protein